MLAALAPASSRGGDCARRWIGSDPSAWRVVTMMAGEADPAVARAIRETGANAIASLNAPDPAAGSILAAAGLGYIARLRVRDVERLPYDAAAVARLRAIPALEGLEYLDDRVEEGYASAATQGRSYAILKGLLPDLLVLYATRLDPVATDPLYLDGYFRPEFSDLVAPYFYPVGNTILGSQQESDPWPARLRSLLGPVAARTPAGKRVLPVLQAFEQAGYPASGALVRDQLAVYSEFWPANRNAAAFWWGGGTLEPIAGMAERPALLRSVAGLFGGAPNRPLPCTVPAR